tara:strand:- start:2141 stop:2503 length:363 start_codon:yes stop_codon:yes gene_type:complete
MFKIKDIFKIAVVGAAGYFGGAFGAKFGQAALGKKIGSALGSSLMSKGSGTGGSQQYSVRAPNLSQYSMPTYASGSARSEMVPGSMRIVDPLAMNAMWENRLNKYLLRRKALSERTVVKV